MQVGDSEATLVLLTALFGQSLLCFWQSCVCLLACHVFLLSVRALPVHQHSHVLLWEVSMSPMCQANLSTSGCRPLSKTVRFNVLRVIPAGSAGKKAFASF